MSPSDRPKSKRVLLIGSLPPPHGGGTISFDYFYRYVNELPHLLVTFVDLHVRKRDAEGRYLGRSPFRTWLRGLAALRHIPPTESVVLFASRRMAFSYGLLLILAARLFRKPVHIRLFGGRPYQRVAVKAGISRVFVESLLSLASGISLETEVGRDDFPARVRRRVAAIPGYRPRCKSQNGASTDDCVRFVYAGRIDRSKGIDVLLAACEQLEQRVSSEAFRVHCYGGATPEFVEACARRPSIQLHGTVDNATYLARLSSFDAFVYPSVYDNEGHPGAVIEAMLCGLPLVSSALPTIMEIVHDGVEGLLFEAGSADSLSRTMERLVSDRGLREMLAIGSGRKGREFDMEVVIPKLLDEMGLAQPDS